MPVRILVNHASPRAAQRRRTILRLVPRRARPVGIPRHRRGPAGRRGRLRRRRPDPRRQRRPDPARPARGGRDGAGAQGRRRLPRLARGRHAQRRDARHLQGAAADPATGFVDMKEQVAAADRLALRRAGDAAAAADGPAGADARRLRAGPPLPPPPQGRQAGFLRPAGRGLGAGVFAGRAGGPGRSDGPRSRFGRAGRRRVEAGAVLVRCLVCPGAMVRRDRTAVDQFVTAAPTNGRPARTESAHGRRGPGRRRRRRVRPGRRVTRACRRAR